MPAIETAALAAAQRATSRALNWASGDLINRWSARKTKQHLTQPTASASELAVTEELQPGQVDDLRTFFGSAEYERIVFSLTALRMLHALGEGSPTQIDDLRTELRHALRLATQIDNEILLSKLTTSVLDLVEISVTAQIAQYFDKGKQFTPQMRAMVVKMAANIATASSRNAGLLQRIDDIGSYLQKEQELKAAYRNAHSKMRLPHANTPTKLVPYSRLFVQPLIKVGSTQKAISDAGKFEDLPALLNETHRVVLLGDPGGGKSTSSTKLSFDISANKCKGLPATSCLYIELRDYAREYREHKMSLLEYMAAVSDALHNVPLSPDTIEYWLLNGRSAVIFDGLDELLETSMRREIVQVVESFCHRYPTTPVLVTSRRVGYEEAPLDPDLFHEAHLDRFGFKQIREYAEKWFKLDTSIPEENRKTLTESFIKDSNFVRDLTANPLLLSLMCSLYASERYIPTNRPDVYERCALLLFEKWDKQRGIAAALPFDAHVQSAMRALALWLYPRSEAQAGLSRERLIEFVKDYLFEKRYDDEDDAEQAATDFIDFCTGRAWVLTDVGSGLYGFTHRTFLEYFAASQLVRTKRSAKALLAELWPHIKRAEWEVVAQLSVQILGRSIDDGADDFLELLLARSRSAKRSTEAYNGISFACRSLSFIVPRPPVLRAIIEEVVDRHCIQAWGATTMQSAIGGLVTGVTIENQTLVAKYFENRIQARLDANPMDQRALHLAWMISSYGYAATRSEVHEFWVSQEEKYTETFAKFIELQAETQAWAAVKLGIEQGRSIRSIVDKFGISALFDPNLGGVVLAIPPSIVVCLTATRDLTDGPRLTEAQQREFYDVLMSSEFPWLYNRQRYRLLSGLISTPSLMRDVSQLHRSLAVLIRLALWEARTPPTKYPRTLRRDRIQLLLIMASEESRSTYTRALARLREGNGEVTPRLLSPLNLLPETTDLVLRWCAGEVHLMGRADRSETMST